MNRYSLKVVNNDRNRMMTDTFVPEVLTLSLGWSANFSGFGFCFHLISALSFAYCDLEKNDVFLRLLQWKTWWRSDELEWIHKVWQFWFVNSLHRALLCVQQFKPTWCRMPSTVQFSISQLQCSSVMFTSSHSKCFIAHTVWCFHEHAFSTNSSKYKC